MFNYPATEIFDAAGKRRVVWSQEEFEAALAEGWLENKPAAAEPAAEPETPAEQPAKPAKPAKK